jgi:hypothetical protein
MRYPAMMAWLKDQPEAYRIQYIAECLASGTDNVFWEIIHDFDLKAQGPVEMAQKVWNKLLETETLEDV